LQSLTLRYESDVIAPRAKKSNAKKMTQRQNEIQNVKKIFGEEN
jgi:hypothetical protein